MSKKNIMALGAAAGLITLAPMAANAHCYGAGFVGGLVGGIVGGAVVNAMSQPRTVVINQGTSVAQPTIIRQEIIEQPVEQVFVEGAPQRVEYVTQPVEQVFVEDVPQRVEYVAQPTTYTTTTYTQPATTTTILMNTTPTIPVFVPGGYPYYREYYGHGYRHGFHGHPVFHGGHHVRPGCRHR